MKTNLKSIFLTAAAAVNVIAAGATTVQTDLFGKQFAVDTIKHFKSGPGMTLTQLRFTRLSDGLWFDSQSIDFDLDNTKNIELKVETGRDTCNTAETISSMARRKTEATRRPVAAINGDFFITSSFAANHPLGNKILGYPNMSSASRGKIISPDVIDYASRENAFILGDDGNMWIDATDLTYTFNVPGKKNPMKIYHANYDRADGEIIIYNSHFGSSTRTAAGGCEFAVEPVEGETWGFNRDIKMRVVTAPSTAGNMAIPANGAVISAGKSRTSQIAYMEKVKVGDEIPVHIGLSLPAFGSITPTSIKEVIGGDVRILKEGVVTTEANRWINTPGASYIRSLIGYSADRRHIVICAIDRGSLGGVSYYEAADLMKFLGCHDALDLDGGGSTELWHQKLGIVNTLRDGSERAVANAFFAFINAPEDNEIAELRFADPALNLPQYATYTPTFYGYNRYGELIDTDVTGVTLSCEPALGDVIDNATSLYVKGSGTHRLTATRNGITATVAVNVTGAENLKLKHTSALIDNHRTWTIGVVSTVGTKEMVVDPRALSWTSSDPSTVKVDELGRVNGLRNGSAQLTGTLGNFSSTVDVTVECPEAAEMSDKALLEASNWKSSVSGGSFSQAADGGLDISCRFSSTRNPYLTLTPTQSAFYSLPSGFRLALDKGNAVINSVKLTFETADKRRPTVEFTTSGDTKNSFTGDFGAIADTSDVAATYPLRLMSVYLDMKGIKASTDYKFSIPSFDLLYKDYSGAGVDGVNADSDGSDAPVEYYNMQGIRVMQPAPGNIYIRRQGSRVSKIVEK